MTMTHCRETIADIFGNWQNPQYLRLHAGEMTAQETRTVRAVLHAVHIQVRESLLCAGDAETPAEKEG